MPDETRLGANFGIDVTNLKAGLAQANRLIRESESEFKAAAAGLDDWSSSEEGLNARIKSLNDITDIQRKKVDALQGEYDRLIAEGLDPTSKKAVDLRTKINNETAALNKNEAELKKQTEALETLGKETEDAADATEDAADKFEGLKKAGGVAAAGIGAIAAAAGAAVGAFLGLAESTREARNNMALLETSFETAGLSAENAESTFTELYGVLGDEGRATEAAQQLAKISKDEKDLAANTRILTGVMAEYGESIPTEGLAEGIAATAAMGDVQGVLADALEWQGVNLDEYNAQLATLATEEERAAFIQSTLTDLYGASADAYRENNAEIIAAQEAQAGLNSVINELGAIAEPIMTTIKLLATDLLSSITPFVSLIGDGLTGAFNGADGAAQTLAEGISGVLTTVLNKVIEIVPFIIETIVAIIPTILTEILHRLPMIITTVVDVIVKVIDAISGMLPEILPLITNCIMWIIDRLIGAIPDLMQAAIKLFTAIVDAVPEIIEGLLANLQDIIITIIWGLMDALPDLLQAAIKLFTAIVDAIPEIINLLTTYLPWIINTIIEGLTEAIPLLLDAAITLLMAIIDALPTIIKALVVELPKIINTITNTLLKNLPLLIQAATTLFFGILEAIPKITVELVKRMPQIISSIVQGLTNGIKNVKDVGKNLVEGLWNGISNSFTWIKNKIKGWVGDVLAFIKKLFGIHSPSKVMADEVGKNLALGIGEGFADNIGAVNKEITDSMQFGSANVNNTTGSSTPAGGVSIYQTNYYSQAHSRYELYKSKQLTAAAVQLAVGG